MNVGACDALYVYVVITTASVTSMLNARPMARLLSWTIPKGRQPAER